MAATVTDANFQGSATGALVIAKADQTVIFAPLAARTYGAPPFTISATATSGLTTSFVSSNPAVATVSGTAVTIVGAGTTTVSASQGGDNNYNPAPPIPQTLIVNKAATTVTLGNLVQNYDGMPKEATATIVPPGLNVIITYNGSTTPLIKKGNYTVVATINDPNYLGSASGTLQIKRGTQKITFAPLPPKPYGDPPLELTATHQAAFRSAIRAATPP